MQSEDIRVDMIIRKNSCNGQVNPAPRIANSLKLQIRDYGNHIKVSSFYKKLQNESNEIPAKDLLVLGILLSSGSPFTKARLQVKNNSCNKSKSIYFK